MLIGGTTLDGQGRLVAGAPVPSLVRWGFSPDADLLYRALVTLGPRSGKWLARDLGLTLRRVDSAIEELLTAGAVDRPAGGPSPGGQGAALRPRPVADVLAALRLRRHLSLNPEPSFTVDVVSAARPLEKRLRDKGIRLRNCGVPADADGRLSGDAGEYRERLRIPTKLMVFDRRGALLPADPFDLAAGALEVDQPAIVSAMVELFEEVWATATDPRKEQVSPIVLTQREKAIVALLAEGHTDAVVAERLGLGQRTIAYSLRALMDRLGVENRFQLGLVLGAAQAAAPPEKTGEE